VRTGIARLFVPGDVIDLEVRVTDGPLFALKQQKVLKEDVAVQFA
jgi:hypothetical protein